MSTITIKEKNKNLSIEFNTEGMTPTQKRTIKSLNNLISEVSLTSDEKAFFENSAELLRLAASLIKMAKFTSEQRTENPIPYDDQVLEFSVEVLQEQIENSKVVSFDN